MPAATGQPVRSARVLGVTPSSVNILVAFGGGIISFLSPCVLPIVPGYLSLVTGLTLGELEEGDTKRLPRIALDTGLFVLGFTAVFVTLFLTTWSVSDVLFDNQEVLTRISGALVLLMAIYLAGSQLLMTPRLYQEFRFQPHLERVGPFAAPVAGAAFGLGWTPCIGPILASILAVASTQGETARGATLLIAYSLGLGLPFLLVGLGFGRFAPALAWVRRHSKAITLVSAALLAVVRTGAAVRPPAPGHGEAAGLAAGDRARTTRRDRIGGGVGDTVRYERDGNVATITYNRPEVLNAINGELRQDLNAAWDRFRDDEDAWIAIVTGAGRSFCAGADLKDGAGSVGTWPGSFWEIPTINSYESGLEIWKPTIAAVNGHCLGYGLTLVTRCDFVIAADDAVFGFPEVRLGVPTIVGALRLARAGGLVERDGAAAHRRPHRRGAAPTRWDWRGRWCRAPSSSPRPACSPTVCCRPRPSPPEPRRRWRRAADGLPWTEAVRFGETMRRVVARTDDAAEGMTAAAEGRPPNWRGR